MATSTKPEAKLVRSIMAWAAKQQHLRLFRNHTSCRPGLGPGQWVQTGLGKGTADLVGWVEVRDSDGETFALWVSIEVKAPGSRSRVTAPQREHLDAVRAAGGIAQVVCSLEEVQELLPAPPDAEEPEWVEGEPG